MQKIILYKININPNATALILFCLLCVHNVRLVMLTLEVKHVVIIIRPKYLCDW